MTFIDAHIFFAPLLIKPQLVAARRSIPRRISTQRNGSFVNLSSLVFSTHQAAAPLIASLYNATE